MSLAIKNGVNAGELAINSTGALNAVLESTTGSSLTKTQRGALSSTDEGLPIMGKNDDVVTFIRTDRKGNIITGNYTPIIIENFEGATVNVQKWTPTNATFAPAQSTLGGYNFNNTSLTTTGASAILQSIKLIQKFPRMPLQFKARLRANIQTNSVIDMGFGIPTTTTLIVPNGVCVRAVNGLRTVAMTYNNAETVTANVVGVDGVTQFSTANLNTEYYVVDGICDDDNFIVTVQNTQTGVIVGRASILVPFTALKMWGATALPFYARLYNSGTPATAPVFTITELQVLGTDINMQSDDSQLAGRLGLNGVRNPFTGAQLANYTNSTAPVSATLSNTAGGYATTIKDGNFQFATIAGAITDYALFGWQVPVGTQFLVEGVRIDTRNTGVAVATTPTTLEWGLAVNGSAVSLATANFARFKVGHQSFAIGAPVESIAPTIDFRLSTPVICESGRFIDLILNVPVGTATASQVIRGQYTLLGRFI